VLCTGGGGKDSIRRRQYIGEDAMENTERFDRDKVTEAETCLIAPCGIYCGACDIKLGRSTGLAREMHRILDGFNFADVGPFFMGVEQERLVDFLNILEQWGNGAACPGCNGGGGNPNCTIRACVQRQGFMTCAECKDVPCRPSAEGGNWLEDTAAFLEMITRRYGGWNVKNLERIQEVGYRRFIDEMEEKVRSGFMTGDVIAGEMVFTEALKRMQGQG
jgi:hypothetical protein